MKIEKYINIEQKVEIELSTEDLVLIFDERIDPEQQGHILSQLSSAYQFIKTLPHKFIDELSDKQKKTIYSGFSSVIECFKPIAEQEKPDGK